MGGRKGETMGERRGCRERGMRRMEGGAKGEVVGEGWKVEIQGERQGKEGRERERKVRDGG